MDSLKLLLWFVKVVLLISRHLPNKTKLDQDFKACWSLCFELKVLKNESKCSMTWFRCAFGNAFKKDPFQLNLNWTPWKIRIHHYKVFSNMRKSCPPGIPLVGGGWVCELELVIAANWRCAISFLSRFWSSIDIDPLTIFVKPLLVGGTESSFWGVGCDFKVLIFSFKEGYL